MTAVQDGISQEQDAAAPPLIPKLIARSDDIVGDGNFPQGCSFSPDGLCVLTSTASDHRLRLYNTPPPIHSKVPEQSPDLLKNETVSSLRTALYVNGGDTVRSYGWYPSMNSADPSTCCFLSSSRDQPIHLIDAYTSRIRASYRAYNALDEMESPTVATFTPDGQRIFAAGFRTDRTIHVFETGSPGRDSTILRLGKTRRSSDGQKGLVSALTFSPQKNIFAVGTYSPGSIYLYDDRMSGAAGTILNGVCVVGHGRSHSRKKRRFESMTGNDDDFSFSVAKIRWFQGRARGGITSLLFSPGEEFVLYSASRRSDSILAWDVRMISGNPDYASCPIRGLKAFSTDSDTNQRIVFDFDQSGSRLFAGGRDNCLRIYNFQSGKLISSIDGMDDVVNGVSYSYNAHYNCGMLAVAVGARSFLNDSDCEFDAGEVTQGNSIAPGAIELYRL